ncbi:MAG: NADH-quinone oxidoreductase subunit C [Nitrospirota bacterium]|nr:NADH-quinone oxidoreductase subunit C [Nitrospirota bacterium]
MTQEEIVKKIEENFEEQITGVYYFAGQGNVSVKAKKILDICKFLRDEPGLEFDYLADLAGADYPDRPYEEGRFEVVYNLYSTKRNHRIRIKVGLPEDNPVVESVVGLWVTADWHEREAFDLYGIKFNNHPNLKRILMPDDYQWHPLRKEFPVQGY